MIMQATLIMGIVLGTILLLAAVFNFVRHQNFGLGGVVFVIFGSMLFGLSIWRSVELQISSDGGITAKYKWDYKQDIGKEAAEQNNQLEKLRLQVKTNQDDIEKITSSITMATISVAEKQEKELDMEKFDANSKYSILIFNKSSKDEAANKIKNQLLSEGFKSSATETDLTESKRQFNSNEAWIIYTPRGGEIIGNVEKIVSNVAPNIKFVFEPNPLDLRRGDIQILLF